MNKKIILSLIFILATNSAHAEKLLYDRGYFYKNNYNNQTYSNTLINGPVIRGSIKKNERFNVKQTREVNERTLNQQELTDIQFDIDTEAKVKGNLEFKKNTSMFAPKTSEVELNQANVHLQKDITDKVQFNSKVDFTNFNKNNKSEILSDTYLKGKIDDKHDLYFGYTTVTSGEDKTPEFLKDMDDNLKQNRFSSTRDLGVKVGAKHEYLDYSVGAYNNDYEGKNSLATGGWVSLKPLKKVKGKGHLEVGGGYYSNIDNQKSPSKYGLFTGYNYKKYALQGEYSRKNYGMDSMNYADSWNLSNIYSIYDNLKFKTKVNIDNEDKTTQNEIGLEYSLKDLPVLDAENFSVEVNAANIKKINSSEDTQRFGFKTKYSF